MNIEEAIDGFLYFCYIMIDIQWHAMWFPSHQRIPPSPIDEAGKQNVTLIIRDSNKNIVIDLPSRLMGDFAVIC